MTSAVVEGPWQTEERELWTCNCTSTQFRVVRFNQELFLECFKCKTKVDCLGILILDEFDGAV